MKSFDVNYIKNINNINMSEKPFAPSFKGQVSQEDSSLNDETLKTASDAASAIGKASISINKQKGKVKDPEIIRKVSEMISTGATIKEVAKELNISDITVAKIMKNEKIMSPRQLSHKLLHDEKVIKQITDLADSGMTPPQIAKETSFKLTFVRSVLKNAGRKSERQFLMERANDEAFKSRVIDDFNKGMSVRKIAATEKTSTALVYQVLKAEGLQTDGQIANEKIKTPEFKQTVLELIEKGATLDKISQETGIKRQMLVTFLTDNNIKSINQEKMEYVQSEEFHNEVVELARQGFNIDEISEKTGISNHIVRNTLTANNVKTELQTYKDKLQDPEFINELIEMYKSGKSVTDICNELGVSRTYVVKTLNQAEIRTEKQLQSDRVTSPEFREDVLKYFSQGMNAAEIAKMTGTSSQSVLLLLAAEGMKTELQKSIEKINSPEFQELVIEMHLEGLDSVAISDLTGICDDSILRIINNAGFLTERQAKRSLANDEDFKNSVVELYKEQMSAYQISLEKNVSCEFVVKILNEAGIITKAQLQYRKGKDEAFKQEIVDMYNNGLSTSTIAKKKEVSNPFVLRVLNNAGIITEGQKKLENYYLLYSGKIKEKIKEGCAFEEIARDLNLSKTTLYRIIKNHKLLPDDAISVDVLKNKNYDGFSVEQLKETLFKFMCDKNISDSESITSLIDFLYEQENYSTENKKILVDFVKLLDEISSGKCSSDEAENAEISDTVFDWQNRVEQAEKEKSEKHKLFAFDFQSLLNSLAKSSPVLYQVCQKYQACSFDETDNIENMKHILSVQERTKDDFVEFEKQILYWDLIQNPNELLKQAQNYAKTADGKIDDSKAGEYILSVREFNDAMNDTHDENKKELIEILKKKFINGVKKDMYVEANRLLEMYDETSDTFKSEFLKTAQKADNKYQNNIYLFADELTKFHEDERFWDIDNPAAFVVDSEKYNQKTEQVALITPQAKKKCWEACNGNTTLYDSYIRAFYSVANRTTGQRGAQGIHPLKNLTIDYSLKILGELGDWRMYPNPNVQATAEEVEKYGRNGKIDYYFVDFGNHQYMKKFKP